MVADHAVVSNQTNSQPNVIAAVDNLIKGVTNVTIQGVSSRATYASIKSGTNIGNILVGDCICNLLDTLLPYHSCLIH